MMTQAMADLLVAKALKQSAVRKRTTEASKLRKALISGSKSSLLKRLAN